MENHLQISSHNLSTPLQPKEVEIAKEIWHVNQLVAYPLSDFHLEAWARSLNELLPDLDVTKLKMLINDMKTGRVEWDYRKGIQNIFKNLCPFPIEVYTEPTRRVK